MQTSHNRARRVTVSGRTGPDGAGARRGAGRRGGAGAGGAGTCGLAAGLAGGCVASPARRLAPGGGSTGGRVFAASGSTRGRRGLHVLGAHHERARHLLGQHLEDHIAQADVVAFRQLGALHLPVVHEDAVGAAGVADRDPLGTRLQDRVAARALRVADHQLAGRVASDDRDRALERDLVRLSHRVSDLEPQITPPSGGTSTAIGPGVCADSSPNPAAATISTCRPRRCSIPANDHLRRAAALGAA
jgi:hypothetical protein